MITTYTYAQLRTAKCRADIKEEEIASVGTQSGGFGNYQEHFRTVSTECQTNIKNELIDTAGMIGVTYDELLQSIPTLSRLLR